MDYAPPCDSDQERSHTGHEQNHANVIDTPDFGIQWGRCRGVSFEGEGYEEEGCPCNGYIDIKDPSLEMVGKGLSVNEFMSIKTGAMANIPS